MTDAVRERYGFVDHMPTRSDMATIFEKGFRDVKGIMWSTFTLHDSNVYRFYADGYNQPTALQMKSLRLLVRDLRALGFAGVKSTLVRKSAHLTDNGYFQITIPVAENPSLSIVNGKPTRTAVRRTHADLIVDELVSNPIQTYTALHDRMLRVDPNMTSSQWSNAIRWLNSHGIITNIEILVPDPLTGDDNPSVTMIVLESAKVIIKGNAQRGTKIVQVLEAGKTALADRVRNGGRFRNDPDRRRTMAERDRIGEAKARGRNAG